MARWSRRRIEAARCAIAAMLAGEPNAGDWPDHVTVEDLEGALSALTTLEERLDSKKGGNDGG